MEGICSVTGEKEQQLLQLIQVGLIRIIIMTMTINHDYHCDVDKYGHRGEHFKGELGLE